MRVCSQDVKSCKAHSVYIQYACAIGGRFPVVANQQGSLKGNTVGLWQSQKRQMLRQ